jgi:hypothetical protein
MLPIWQEQEDLIKKLRVDLKEAKKINEDQRDHVKPS